jgi:hypothetical protein
MSCPYSTSPKTSTANWKDCYCLRQMRNGTWTNSAGPSTPSANPSCWGTVKRAPTPPGPSNVLVADRGRCSYAHLALLVQAGVHAVPRVGARQLVDVTPDRPFVRPSVRWTSAVKGVPRSRWLNTTDVHDPPVAWLKSKTCPSWLAGVCSGYVEKPVTVTRYVMFPKL